MDIPGVTAVVTGAASGLGWATAEGLHAAGAKVLLLDLPQSEGAAKAARLGDNAAFAPADVTEESQVEQALDAAERLGPIRALVHCAGRGGPLRILDKEGRPGDQAHYEAIVRVNLFGTFNVLRLTAARMAALPPQDGDRGVCVLTASIAAFEGQVGQIPYASSKAGIVGMTLVAARDLAQRQIRVCSVAPGVFDTPMLARVPAAAREALAATVPHPARLGSGEDFARLAVHIIENPMLNGETIRLDGALRMPPR